MIDRRRFVTELAGGSALLLGGRVWAADPAPPAAAASAKAKSRVALVRHSGVIVKDEIQAKPLAAMADQAVMTLSGEDTPEKAWQRYFKPGERVGIKVNGRGGSPLSTSTLLIAHCVDRLKGIGIKPADIIIWEMRVSDLNNCGLYENTAWGAQVTTADVEWDAWIQQGSFSGALTSIVTKRVDAILNLPLLKDHHNAGITLALKNHYGSICNPMAHHGNYCDPYIADLNTVPALRDKQRLIITDGTRGQAEGGPHYSPGFVGYPNLIMAASDPVAHDYVGWQLIETQRKHMGLPPVARVGRPAIHIHSAAQRGLGTDVPEEIDQAQVTLA
ncbi:MAG: DUF362 domain-containing protein [Armatimonadetes bacterium]|nr:DUF362 domain-containing protein [Armatimonadota bacterium]